MMNRKCLARKLQLALGFQGGLAIVGSALLVFGLWVWGSEAVAAPANSGTSRWAAPKPSTARRNQDRNWLRDLSVERDEEIRDLEWVLRPVEGPSLHGRIFTDALNQEFKTRYEERFGRTEIERVALAPNRFTYYNDVYGFRGTPEEVTQERRRFAEFMMRRLAEWHFENYAKNDPKVRPVWEAKEKISNLKVEVASFRIDARYSLSGNVLDVNMVNPWVKSHLTLEMDPNSMGPGPVRESIWTVVKPIHDRYTVEARWRVSDGIVSIIQHRPVQLGRFGGWHASLTTSAAVKDGGTSTRETLWLAGVGRGF
jgi:hypothetical protein